MSSKSVEKRYAMVFDVETTGLIPSKNKDGTYPSLDSYPYITQLSFIIFDCIDLYVVKNYNAYIKLPAGVTISEEVTEITGITNDKCNELGQDIKQVLIEFFLWYMKSDYLIAHNQHFDKTMIRTELKRHFKTMLYEHPGPEIIQMFNREYMKNADKDFYCTMMSSINVCNIYCEYKTKSGSYKKFPKLAELHAKLFDGEIPENLHNSLVDALVCLRCYMKLRFDKDIHPAKYRHMLKNVMKMA